MDTISLIKYGNEAKNAALKIGVEVTRENCTTPNKWHGANPIIPKAMLVRKLFDLIPIPHNITRNKNPQINPPVIPNNFPKPPPKFEKTGKPIAPRIIYVQTAASPLFQPRIYPQSAIAKVCNVTGTPDGKGMASCESVIVNAVKRPIIAMFLVDDFVFIFMITSFYPFLMLTSPEDKAFSVPSCILTHRRHWSSILVANACSQVLFPNI